MAADSDQSAGFLNAEKCFHHSENAPSQNLGMESIGSRLRAERERQKLTLQAVAKKAGVGTSTVAELEAGRRRTTTRLIQLARALNVNPDWLESGKGLREVVRNPEHCYIAAESLEDLARQLVARGNDEIAELWRLVLKVKEEN